MACVCVCMRMRMRVCVSVCVLAYQVKEYNSPLFLDFSFCLQMKKAAFFCPDIVIKSNTPRTQQILVLFPTTATGDQPRSWIMLFFSSLCPKPDSSVFFFLKPFFLSLTPFLVSSYGARNNQTNQIFLFFFMFFSPHLSLNLSDDQTDFLTDV